MRCSRWALLLFIVLYCMINPSVLGAYFGRPEAQPLAKAIMGAACMPFWQDIYCCACGVIFCRRSEKMRTYLSALLVILSVVLVYLVFGAGFGGLLDDFAALYAGNTQATSARSLSAVFLVLGWLADSLPYLLDIMIIFAALALLRALVNDRYADAALAAASRLAHLCGVSLVATILQTLALIYSICSLSNGFWWSITSSKSRFFRSFLHWPRFCWRSLSGKISA